MHQEFQVSYPIGLTEILFALIVRRYTRQRRPFACYTLARMPTICSDIVADRAYRERGQAWISPVL
jgi:hypothetical protein